MTTPPSLPSDLWALRDTAVEHALTGCPLPSDFKRLYEWLDGDGWDALTAAWLEGDEVLNFDELYPFEFSDSELVDYEGLDINDPINDDMRVRFFREQINRVVANADLYNVKGVHAYKVEREDGKSAVIGCITECHGQGGMVSIWQGVFRTQEALFNHLRNSGFWLVREVEELDAAEVLAVWRKIQENN